MVAIGLGPQSQSRGVIVSLIMFFSEIQFDVKASSYFPSFVSNGRALWDAPSKAKGR